MSPSPPQTRLWIISELYYPEITSTGYYITGIAESLASEADVRIICGQPNYAARGKAVARFETRNHVRITRVWGLRLDKNVFWFRVLNMLSLSISVFLKQLSGFVKGDSVLVVTTPPLLPFVTAVAALVRGAGYTLLVHDLYPEQLIATGILERQSVITTAIDLMNRWVYKHARSIIVVGRDMKELLENKTADLEIPVVFIPNWAETHEITPEERGQNELLNELDLRDNFVVLSAGNFGRPNDLETILAAADLLSSDSVIQFLFIGSGAKEEWLRSRSAKLPNVMVLNAMPREKQNLFLNACDVTIASFVPGMCGAAMASRVYNYLAAGKPVIAICQPASELAKIIEEDHVGQWVESSDAEGLARAIVGLRDSPDLLAKMAGNARTAAVAKYSPELVLPRFREALFCAK